MLSPIYQFHTNPASNGLFNTQNAGLHQSQVHAFSTQSIVCNKTGVLGRRTVSFIKKSELDDTAKATTPNTFKKYFKKPESTKQAIKTSNANTARIAELKAILEATTQSQNHQFSELKYITEKGSKGSERAVLLLSIIIGGYIGGELGKI